MICIAKETGGRVPLHSYFWITHLFVPSRSVKMNVLYTGIVWMFTLIVCSLHIGIITRQYLLYDTTTKMTIRHEDTIDIPVVVVCMSSDWTGDNVSDFFAYQHRDENITLHTFEMEASGCGTESRSFCNTGGRLILFNLTFTQETSDIFSVIRFVRGRKRCFAFRFRQRRFDVSRAASTISYEIYNLIFKRGEESPSDLSYYLLHPDHGDPVVESRCDLNFYYARAKNVRLPIACLNYQRRETRLLESPYETRCLNYSTMGLQSQLHCLNDCILRSAGSKLDIIPDDVSVFAPNASSARVWNDSFWKNSTISAALSSIRKSCNQKCSNKDCMHHSFQPHSDCRIVSNNGVMFGKYYLNVPNFPLILIETRASTTVLAYFMMSLNIISLWTAFSPIHMATDSVINVLERIISGLQISSINKKIKLFYDRSFRLMIIMTCLLSCMWQLRESADQYFKYPTVSKVLIQFEDPVLIPAVTLCKSLQPKQFNNTSYAFVFEAFKNDSINFINFDGQSENVIINDYYCITVNPHINTKKIGDPQDNELMTFGIRHLQYNLTKFRCLMHDAFTRVHGHYTSYAVVPMSYICNQVVLSYTKFTSTLLLAPYDSMCRDYRDTAFQSQHHCIESCAVTHSLKNKESYPSFMSALYEPLATIFNPYSASARHTEVSTLCRSKCPALDCMSNKYSPRSDRWNDRRRNVSIETKFTLSSSQSPTFITVLLAAIDPVNFITYFLGCIAFWTGLYPISLLLSRQILKHMNGASLLKRTKRMYIAIVVTASAAAYLFQVFTISDSYFKYSTSNTIDFASDDAMEIPAIDFCFPVPTEFQTS